MIRHFRELSQRARLIEFAKSESGAMSAQKAAQMGAVLAASALAGLLMSIPRTAEAACSFPFYACENNPCTEPAAPFCRFFPCGGDCGHWCTADPNPNQGSC